MAYSYYVDDGGDGTQINGANGSWATADTNIKDADTTITFASDDIVYFGSDSTDPNTYSAGLTITGPTSGAPVNFVSASTATTAYTVASANQIDTDSYGITFDGSFALYGMQIKCGGYLTINNDADETFLAKDCTFTTGYNQYAALIAAVNAQTLQRFIGCTFISGDTGASSTQLFLGYYATDVQFIDCDFQSWSNRSGVVLDSNSANYDVLFSGCDFTDIPSSCEIASWGMTGQLIVSNCITAATWTPLTTAYPIGQGVACFTNCGPADDPTYLYYRARGGSILSYTTIYRTGGATIDDVACSWHVVETNSANTVNEASPLYTPWIYGDISSTGSKTFTLYIVNDTADFTDAQVWLEVEFLGTADEAKSEWTSDWRATATSIVTAAANQTDDTDSTWVDNDTKNPTFTYKQSLAVTATVNETGQFRARVAIAVASVATTRNLFIDPKVTVT